MLVGSLLATHHHFPNSCCPYILVCVVASNTTSHLLITSHLSGTQLMPTTCTCKIIFVQFGLCENYFMRIFVLTKMLLDEKSENFAYPQLTLSFAYRNVSQSFVIS